MGGDALDCLPPDGSGSYDPGCPTNPPCNPIIPPYPHNCCVKFTFCVRCCGDTIQAALTSFTPWNNVCNDADPQNYYDSAAKWARDFAVTWNGPNSCPTGDCQHPHKIIKFSTPTCWKFNTITGYAVWIGCTPIHYCRCDYVYSVCIDSNGNPVYTPITASQTGGCDCTTKPTPPGIWGPSTCYTLDCPLFN